MDGVPREGPERPAGFQSDEPRFELDDLLAQLVDRAQDVRATQEKLRGLLRASQSIVSDLAPGAVLRRIVEYACELLQAQYGALGVVSPDGHGLEQFIHVGMDEAAVERIGHLPEGKGVLGALIDDPRPIRLRELSEDTRSIGFPDHHPPMHTFLGVPIMVRGEVFGNLYLTECSRGEFTSEDVELARALAAIAAVAIENARLFAESRGRQEWLQASTNITMRILSAAGEDTLTLVAESVRKLAAADVTTLVLPTVDRARLSVAVAVGIQADELVGSSYPIENTLTQLVLDTGTPLMTTGGDADSGRVVYLREVVSVGPAMVLPLAGRDGVRGALVVGRRMGGRRFTESDLDMATTFANQAALAIEMADARRDQQRFLLFEERDRIARDLHDHVIQQLFAAGLTLQGITMGLGDRKLIDRIDRVVDSLDAAIQQIRTSIFDLRDHLGPTGLGVRAAVLEVVSEVGAGLGVEPQLHLAGPIDSVVDSVLADELVAVVRELLTNVARHAQAQHVDLWLTADAAALELRVADDGGGMGDSRRRSGLENLRERAERRRGTFTIGVPRSGRGAELCWSVPIDLDASRSGPHG